MIASHLHAGQERPPLHKGLLTYIRSCRRGVDELVIVDNGSDQDVADYLAAEADKYRLARR